MDFTGVYNRPLFSGVLTAITQITGFWAHFVGVVHIWKLTPIWGWIKTRECPDAKKNQSNGNSPGSNRRALSVQDE